MSNEFLTRDEKSTSSNSSQQKTSTEEYIGHDFASSIRISDLAIRSTAYNISPTNSETTPVDEEAEVELSYNKTTKAKRRVTFNLDNIQIKTISDYESISSGSSVSDTSLLQYEEDTMSTSTLCNKQQEPIIYEPISKKASYDAPQKRKQFRHDHQQPTSKPGYWYPLASPRTPNTTNLTPTIRSLEFTEKLISEAIQREMLLNPQIQQFTPPSPSPSPRSDTDESTSSSIIQRDSLIIIDSDEDVEDLITTIPSDEPITVTSHIEDLTSLSEEDEPTTTIPINEDNEPITIALSNEENEPTTIISVNEEDESTNKILSDEKDNDFSKSVYRQVSPISDYEQLFPFKQNLVPIVTNDNVLIISPPPSPQFNETDNSSDSFVWVDHTSLLINRQKQERRGVFFVKVLKAESLDFPIENDHIKTFCTINYKGNIVKSSLQNMTHTMDINHEMRIEDVDAKEQIAITIHVEKKGNMNNWYNRIRSSSDLDRYIHEKDGSICQTLFCPSRFAIDGSIDQKATLMLVNNWYHETNSTPSLLLKRTSLKKKKSVPNQTKAVGKIYIQCLYITVANSCKYIPKSINEALEALNIKRFHRTKWQCGYLFHKNHISESFKKRYFTLTGGNLFVQLSAQEREPSYKIPLSNIKRLTWDQTNVEDPFGFQLGFENGDFIYFSCLSLDDLKKWITVLKVMIYKLPKLPEWVTA